MTAFRRIVLATAVSTALSAGVLPGLVRAQDAASDVQDVETAKHNFIGVINGSNVFVRSAPREDAYPTLKLEKGTKVTVVGIKFKWLKILPPEGSFAYVPKAYVNARSDGKIGRASREVIAKVGSTLNQLKTSPMGKVDDGQDVEIIGDQDEYWKIKPPAGSFVYVNETFVDPLKALPTIPDQKAPDSAGPVAPVANAGHPKETAKPATPAAPNEGVPVTPDAAVTGAAPVADPAPAAPVAPQVAETFDKLEADFKAGNEKAIADQPIKKLLAGYEDLLKQEMLTSTIRKVSEVRVATLKLREEAQRDYLAAKEQQVQAADRQKALTAEQQEIQDRIHQKEVRMYTACGTLRASSIQRGHGVLYRLTDPATGRSIAYVQTSDSKYAGLLGQFIGVKGKMSIDPVLNIKLISQPSDAEAIDPTKLNSSITAQIMPPSLMAQHASNSPTD